MTFLLVSKDQFASLYCSFNYCTLFSSIYHCFFCSVSVNQIELTPYLTWDDLVKYCECKGIVIQAYSPLTKAQKLQDPKLVAIAKKYVKIDSNYILYLPYYNT